MTICQLLWPKLCNSLDWVQRGQCRRVLSASVFNSTWIFSHLPSACSALVPHVGCIHFILQTKVWLKSRLKMFPRHFVVDWKCFPATFRKCLLHRRVPNFLYTPGRWPHVLYNMTKPVPQGYYTLENSILSSHGLKWKTKSI